MITPALLSSEANGKLDVARLIDFGLPLYPPLTPLRTLPNLVLAHVAIQLGMTGESGTRAGEEAAGLAALVEGFRWIQEGRLEVVLAGGADSRVDAASVRDGLRLGRFGPNRAPGEGAAIFRLESLESALARNHTILAEIVGGGEFSSGEDTGVESLERRIGACGAAMGPLALHISLSQGGRILTEAGGASAWLAWIPATLC